MKQSARGGVFITLISLFLLAAFLTASTPALALTCDVDHGGADWNVTSNTNASGHHCNIRDFWLQPGVNLTIDAYNVSNSTTGWLFINATRDMHIYGAVIGDGLGHGGGSGAGGGAAWTDSSGSPSNGGAAGLAGQNGTAGTAGTSNNPDGTCNGCTGGNGGPGSPGVNGGNGGSPGTTPQAGSAGSHAPANTDTTPAINYSTAHAGGGGGGGGGRSNGADGDTETGGAGGGAGQDAGASFMGIARERLFSNGTILMRAGQTACANIDGGSSTTQPHGGTGGDTFAAGCKWGAAGDNNAWFGGGREIGANGGEGGRAAGGSITLAAAELNLSGAALNVSGGLATNNGTIKILYAGSVKENGTYAGYSALVYSNISDPWFQSNAITWEQNLSNVTQNWNASFYLDANATNVSTECLVGAYTSNSSHFPINASTGVISFAANISKVGAYSLQISANDSCANTISQDILVNITYNAPNLTGVAISPAPTGTSSPLACALTISNPDGSSLSNTTRWYRNGTLQPSLENVSSVAIGNLTLGDSWICSAQIRDAITTVGFTNSTALVLGDVTAPSLHLFWLSTTTIVVNSGSVTASVNCTDTETIGSVKMEITEPSTAKTNFTATLAGGIYSYAYPPGVTGEYTARAYCTDGSGNVNSSSVLSFTATSPPAQGSSGGSSGSQSPPVESRRACEIVLSPDPMTLTRLALLEEVTITNEDNASFTPTFSFATVEGEPDITRDLKITNPVVSLLQGRSSSFGVQYEPTGEENWTSALATLRVSSSECLPINVSVVVDLESSEIPFDHSLLKEPVFGNGKAPLFTIGVLFGLTFLIYAALLSGAIGKSAGAHKPFQVMLWILFIIIASTITDVIAVLAIRSFTGG